MTPKIFRANPLAFTPWPVTLLTAAIYLAFAIPLLVIHQVVPPAPTPSATPHGLNLSEAWTDLQLLTDGFRPYNSHQNDLVRGWLLERIGEITATASTAEDAEEEGDGKGTPEVVVFDDLQSNLTFAGSVLGSTGVGVYFEGTNIMVYIRGSEDEKGDFWEDSDYIPDKGGVLVNAHYDSVSTGYGATDDGVGVVTCLQLLRYFTTPGHAPRHGLVVLFNNGEEDFLNGARVYSQHPISKFTKTFLNLEGAGAGGRATLFRSSDTEITHSYAQSEHPFGSILSANGFETGLIRSQTDYVVFEGDMGLRGLDVAFMEPRARYHTDQDDSKHTTVDSLWHMLSAAVATTETLVSEDSGPKSGSGSRAVWFDMFGSAFVVFRLHTLFALSVTLLVVAPLTLLATSIALVNVDRMYLFRSTALGNGISLGGARGFFRFPFLVGVPTAVTIGLAYLVTKINPYIVHSSPYAVWAMMGSSWIFLSWFASRVADFARPSAFHRVHTLTWLFIATWAMLVAATVYENQRGLAGGYFIFFYFAGVFLATWISYLEMFFLPRKAEYVSRFVAPLPPQSSYSYGTNSRLEPPSEATSLLRGGRGSGGHGHGHGHRTTFANYTRVASISHSLSSDDTNDSGVYGFEQLWSSYLPKWTWILQFILIAPIVLMMTGPLALLLTTALQQTGQDGSPALFIYICIASLTALLFSPLVPFIHRYTHHIPLFMLSIFIGTMIYNLVAFPFSESNRLKLFFIQDVDLNTGVNHASLTGVMPFVHDVASDLPSVSAAGEDVTCAPLADRVKCTYPGLFPHVTTTNNNNTEYQDWLSFNITRSSQKQTVQFSITGQNTRACKLVFDEDTPIPDYHVHNSAYDEDRFPHVSVDEDGNALGTREIRLWSRAWDGEWVVDVDLPTSSKSDTEEVKVKGRVVCMWSDQNEIGNIPALDEVRRYAPAWVGVSKLADGLVEGYKGFEI
ncbi:M28 family metallopeptidase [Aspergillus glaucus CBS 516.65]|uniref:Peptide hydrolase n=1 Tax=Aspergillus glaucus CBS 516.65 TaxID=1160497 RepID=A0A1L9W0R7_ASPGL|nr:hypothetical protein ASPGLDRAFT_284017 [Aspergillus glaucus CBS 516.65]OJJ89687.1 hypothetical protein ASPGLDRAFT_284017 [Aspergillus glaucus CBS 516.65]